MKKTVVIYGSTTGSCEDYANRIASKLGADVFNVTDVDGGKVEAYDYVLLHFVHLKLQSHSYSM